MSNGFTESATPRSIPPPQTPTPSIGIHRPIDHPPLTVNMCSRPRENTITWCARSGERTWKAAVSTTPARIWPGLWMLGEGTGLGRGESGGGRVQEGSLITAPPRIVRAPFQ